MLLAEPIMRLLFVRGAFTEPTTAKRAAADDRLLRQCRLGLLCDSSNSTWLAMRWETAEHRCGSGHRRRGD